MENSEGTDIFKWETIKIRVARKYLKKCRETNFANIKLRHKN